MGRQLFGRRLVFCGLVLWASCRFRRRCRQSGRTIGAASRSACVTVAHSGTCHTSGAARHSAAAFDGRAIATDAGPYGLLALARLLRHGGGAQHGEQADGGAELLHRVLHIDSA